MKPPQSGGLVLAIARWIYPMKLFLNACNATRRTRDTLICSDPYVFRIPLRAFSLPLPLPFSRLSSSSFTKLPSSLTPFPLALPSVLPSKSSSLTLTSPSTSPSSLTHTPSASRASNVQEAGSCAASTETGKMLRYDSVICVLLWWVMRAVIQLPRWGRQMRNVAVAQRNGLAYSSTWRSRTWSSALSVEVDDGADDESVTSS